MKMLVDVVNFNADASCLSTKEWFRILEGGGLSLLCQWLRLYSEKGKKIVLGLTGSTIADMAIFNPEAIRVIRESPSTFQIIVRPFSHDIALLRSEAGFCANLNLGLRTIRREFGEVAPYFLPPEFMLTNEQVSCLARAGIRGTFINSARFSQENRVRIPLHPYMVRGVFNAFLECIPCDGFCTSEYLRSIHLFDCAGWNGRILAGKDAAVFSWRDGESSFFLPDGIRREAYWLDHEDRGIVRTHLCGADIDYLPNDCLENGQYRSYPVHSFLPWMREFRMLSFVNRLMRLEHSLPGECFDDCLFAWLLATGSDILSAIEKKSPIIQIKSDSPSKSMTNFTIMRSERGFEGEEYLLLAEESLKRGHLPQALLNPDAYCHHRRYMARMKYLHRLQGAPGSL